MTIAQLEDGTELNFPDDMPDEEIDQRVEKFVQRTSIIDAIERMRVDLINEHRKGYAAMIEAELRPRELVRDAMDKPKAVRPVPKRSAN